MSRVTAAVDRDTAGRRNLWCFGVGALGRDMVFTLIALWLLYYLTEIRTLDDTSLVVVTSLLVGTQIVNAVVDLVAGALIDGSRSRWGQFKPWLVVGGLSSGVATVLLFTDTRLTGWPFVAAFAVFNLIWGVGWAMHEVAYWGMLPSLSLHPGDRANLASIAKVFTTLGAFVVAAGTLPVTGLLGHHGSSARVAWLWLAVGCAVCLNLSLLVTVVGVRERANLDIASEPLPCRTSPRTRILLRSATLLRNDQAVWAAVAYLLFMLSSSLTTGFGPYYFTYVYGDAHAFNTFVLIAGAGQLTGYLVFPRLRARIARGKLFTGAAALMIAGYGALFFAPANLIVVGACAAAVFLLGSVVQLLVVVYLADTIEYGQWKFGERQNALTSALAPLIHKASIAASMAVVGVVVVGSGINRALNPADIDGTGRLMVRGAMFAVPAILLVAAIVVWRCRLILDEDTHARIVVELGETRNLL